MTHAELGRAVREHLGQEHRYAHVVRVARLAERLAMRHGEDVAAARLAGMLHDLARLMSADQLLSACAARGMTIDDFERRHPVVLHARLGAELARERFGVTDERVLSAIRAHTVAGPGLTRLDEILYLADGLEPGRDFPKRAQFEALAFDDLATAMHVVLSSTFAYLKGRNLEPAPQMLAAYAHYERLAYERSPLSA